MKILLYSNDLTLYQLINKEKANLTHEWHHHSFNDKLHFTISEDKIENQDLVLVDLEDCTQKDFHQLVRMKNRIAFISGQKEDAENTQNNLFKKPKDLVAIQRLEKKLSKGKIENSTGDISIRFGRKIHHVSKKEIAYFYEAEGLVLLVTKTGYSLPIKESLAQLLSRVNPRVYLNIKKGFYVHLDAIVSVNIGDKKCSTLVELTPSFPENFYLDQKETSNLLDWLKSHSSQL